MLWVGSYTSFYFSQRWAASKGDLLSFTGCAALGGGNTLGYVITLGGYTFGGGTTLGGGTVGEITGVSSGAGLVG